MVLCHSMNVGSAVGISKPYHMQKNLFELLALTGGRGGKTLGISTHGISRPQRGTIMEHSQYLILFLIS